MTNMSNKSNRMTHAASLVVALLMVSTAASAFTLLNPPRKWFTTPRMIDVDSRGLASVSSPDPDRGVSLSVGAVEAWDSGGITPTAGRIQNFTTITLGDGNSDLVFGDPIGACSGNCLAATFTGYYNTNQTGTCGALSVVAITDSDVVFNTAYDYTTVAEGGCSNEIFLESVVTHEVGHVIGLGHSNTQSALMYASVAFCDNKQLAADDINGRDALYNCASCGAAGATCTANSQCCSNSCKGKPGQKKCK